jgi:hypothetical protein
VDKLEGVANENSFSPILLEKLDSRRFIVVDYVFLLIAVTFAFSLGLGFLLEKYLRMP